MSNNNDDQFDEWFFDSSKIEDRQAAVIGNKIMYKATLPWQLLYKQMVKDIRSKQRPARKYYTYRFSLNTKVMTPKLPEKKRSIPVPYDYIFREQSFNSESSVQLNLVGRRDWRTPVNIPHNGWSHFRRAGRSSYIPDRPGRRGLFRRARNRLYLSSHDLRDYFSLARVARRLSFSESSPIPAQVSSHSRTSERPRFTSTKPRRKIGLRRRKKIQVDPRIVRRLNFSGSPHIISSPHFSTSRRVKPRRRVVLRRIRINPRIVRRLSFSETPHTPTEISSTTSTPDKLRSTPKKKKIRPLAKKI